MDAGLFPNRALSGFPDCQPDNCRKIPITLKMQGRDSECYGLITPVGEMPVMLGGEIWQFPMRSKRLLPRARIRRISN